MSHKLCVYTCITGNYDNLHEVKNPEKDVDYYCFTNNPNLKSKTWKIIPIENDGLDDQRLSRKIKMLGHPIISKNYDTSIWMDASIVWDQSITNFVETYFKDAPFAAFLHNQRASVHEEANACLYLQKDTKENITKTLTFLKDENFPDNLGLYEMTVFIKKHNDQTVINTMQIWFDCVKKYSKRDQLSFTYAVWKTGLRIAPIKLNVWRNDWFHSIKHNSSSTEPPSECHIYYGCSNENFDPNKYFVYDYSISGDTYTVKATIENDTDQIEINPTNIIGVYYQNLDFRPHAKNITYPDSVPCNDNLIFCTNHGTIILFGDFKKGQKLFFSIDMFLPTIPNLEQAIQGVWNLRDQAITEHTKTSGRYQKLVADNAKLQQELAERSQQLQDVLNSKRWKLFQGIRKIFPPY